MQIRHDAVVHSRKSMLFDTLVFVPGKLTASAILALAVTYSFYGHDSFMHSLFGFESESVVEVPLQGKTTSSQGQAQARRLLSAPWQATMSKPAFGNQVNP